MSKICIVTLGCPKNVVESEYIAGMLSAKGYILTTDINSCDYALVHTCSFIQDAKEESTGFINALLKLKKLGKIEKLFVSGCLVQSERKKIQKDFKEVDGFIGTGELEKIPDIISRGEGFLCKNPGGLLESKYPRLLSTENASAYLRVSEGCNHKCSFCYIPKIRGNYVSRKIEHIVEEAKSLSELGIKEAVLIAQDVTSYGLDLYGYYALPKLIEKISEISKIKWIRILYGYPASITNKLLDGFKRSKKLCKYIDVPLQHVNERILKIMGRPKGAKRTVQMIKDAVPEIAIRTSIITGFPGETKKEFQELKNFISEGWFDHLGVFEYSDNQKTKSYCFKKRINNIEKASRKNELMKAQKKVVLKKNISRIGTIEEVLVEEKISGNVFSGRTYFQAPEVDNKIIFNGKADIGSFVNVKITGQKGYDLIGKQVLSK
ncbi:MAG: 30S ribosomal protein S12 methylthiotransferase RimO [Elusimicrobia bacterium]|nr:30S ribosomal protein S12 methylthiotransferase RimO [Elusimicrobiota bacterium]